MITTGSAQQTDFSHDPGQEGPGHAYLPFFVMNDMLDKLKLLIYDTGTFLPNPFLAK